MKDKKWYVIAAATIVCILINIGGRSIAEVYSFPLWLDSIGTFIMAYVGGPFCGAVVGLVNNIIYGIFVDQQTVYCLVGALLGVVVGYCARKKVFESPFSVMTMGMCLAVGSTIISVILGKIFYDGSVGNVWGDQLVLMCVDFGIPRLIADFVGQFYIEFLDKQVDVTLLYLLIRISRHFREKIRIKKENIAMFAILSMAGLLMCGSKSYAAQDEEDYDEYTQVIYASDEGLLAGEVNDIVQTKDGKIWVGTYAGLYSYNGNKFVTHNDIESIRNVNDMYVDEEGRLWVATNDNGVTILNNGKVMNILAEEDGLPSNKVTSIACDNGGRYYIGTSAGLCIAQLSGGVKIVKTINNIKSVTSIAANETGNVIAITGDGQIKWFTDGELTDNPISGLGNNEVASAYFTESGRLYMGTKTNIVFYFDIEDNRVVNSKSLGCSGVSNINSFYENENGEIFVCSDMGAGYFNTNGYYKAINTKTFTSCIESAMVDYQGNLWFASSRLGLLKMSKSSFKEIFSETGVDEHVTNAVTVWNGKLYCGTDDGLVVIDEKRKCPINNDLTIALEGIRIRGEIVDSKNALWITTAGEGVYQAKRENSELVITKYTASDGLPGTRFRQVMEMSDGTIAISGDEGVAFIRDGAVVKTFTGEDGLEEPKSLCMLEVGSKLLVGSDGGGITVIEKEKVVRHLGRNNGLSSNVILRMVYDEGSQGIFVVASNGLNYINKEGSVRELDRFPYSNNYDIIPTGDKKLWITGSAGIYVATPKSLIANVNSDYELLNNKRGLRNSLTANTWNCLNDGNLYLCCDEGIVRVNTDSYDLSADSYILLLDRVEIDGAFHEMSRVSTLKIPADARRISFSPEILNYSLNDPYVSYCLEGLENEPVTTRLSEMETIVYSNLKPGKYELVISVWDSSKTKVLETATFPLLVENEMYQNWWFKLYVALVTMLIIAWISWFITRTQMQKRIIQQKYELEYARKQMEMGMETIMSIAHTVDAKDSNTSQHSFRVSEYSVAIAKRYGMDDKQCENLRQMALLHDIGKIGIPDAILNKTERLDDDEYKIMKTHVTRGAEILKDFTMIENVNYGVLYHHEKYDGTGYNKGLKGEEIPIEARIIGIADTFDAMTANRVYRKGLSLDIVIEELKKCSGTQFDPQLVEIMLQLIDEGVINVEKANGKVGEE